MSMNDDLTFPLAPCKAQCGIWLHSPETFEAIGSRPLHADSGKAVAARGRT